MARKPGDPTLPPIALISAFGGVTSLYLDSTKSKYAATQVVSAALGIAGALIAGSSRPDDALEQAIEYLRLYTERASEVQCPDCEKKGVH